MSKETSELWRTLATWLFALLQVGMTLLLLDIRNTQREQGATLAFHTTSLAVIGERHAAEDRKTP